MFWINILSGSSEKFSNFIGPIHLNSENYKATNINPI